MKHRHAVFGIQRCAVITDPEWGQGHNMWMNAVTPYGIPEMSKESCTQDAPLKIRVMPWGCRDIWYSAQSSEWMNAPSLCVMFFL